MCRLGVYRGRLATDCRLALDSSVLRPITTNEFDHVITEISGDVLDDATLADIMARIALLAVLA